MKGAAAGRKEITPGYPERARGGTVPRRRSEVSWSAVAGLLLLLLVAPFLAVALASPPATGLVGSGVARGLVAGLGMGAWLLPPALLALSLQLLRGRPGREQLLGWASGLLLFLDLLLLADRMGGQGGALGKWMGLWMLQAVGPAGTWIAVIAGMVVGLALVCRMTLEELLGVLSAAGRGAAYLGGRLRRPAESAAARLREALCRAARSRRTRDACDAPRLPPAPEESPPTWSAEAGGDPSGEGALEPVEEGLPAGESEGPAEGLADPQGAPLELAAGATAPDAFPSGSYEEPGGQLRLFPGEPLRPRYRLPSLDLLEAGFQTRRARPAEDRSELLVDTLDSFGVQARVVRVVRGPAVTRYELQPARGIKVSRFTSLTNDIALALAAVSVRIEAPIPGKSAIGIEVPNEATDTVVLRDILSGSAFQRSSGLCLGLGKDITGQPVVAALEKMPHLLVAGTTGSGKSVCINCLILSLLYRFTPEQLQLLMVDPKQVELAVYEGLPHLVRLAGDEPGRIIVDPKKAAMALKQVVDLMEERYTLFARARVRNLKEYNHRCSEPLPWVVVIVDELADLMMVASKTVESSICRLAQKARAAGIHMILATQRPSTDVVTGLIKVNIPSRIAFAVSSQVDSRVILDCSGAEHLLGKGDMLFLPVDASDPRRLQGAFVTNEEIQRVVEFWRDQEAPENRIELEVAAPSAEVPAGEDDSGDEDDELAGQALEVILARQQASASMLQTELKVGYARARRILTLLEKRGYVSPADGSKPRKILYPGE